MSRINGHFLLVTCKVGGGGWQEPELLDQTKECLRTPIEVHSGDDERVSLVHGCSKVDSVPCECRERMNSDGPFQQGESS
jgi:hypothetical protein